ncbi:MAG: hldE 4 [Planctomycetaceae bacterium]|nr:hldE 4 [Planctomycetaceae bacterium]
MSDLHAILEQLGEASRKRILVLGDIMLDRYTWGDAERVSPEAPVIVLIADQHEIRPGGAAIGILMAMVVSTSVYTAFKMITGM